MERKKREAHSKSRRGCQNCKKRHVKCDEQGPPCANCIVRKITCIYPSPAESSAKPSITALTRRPKKTPRSDPSPPECTSDSSSVINSTFSIAPSPVPSLSPSLAAFSSTPESHRLLELELMHRWTTRTYLALCCVPEDTPHLQDYVPCAALHNSYLMNGILALSALELSRASSSPSYLPAAIEYSNRASADFRSQLSNITRENLHLLYYFAMIAATFNFALPPEQTSAMARMGIAFDMVIGAVNIAMTNWEWLFDSPISGNAVMAYGTTTMDIVDLETRRALDRLTAVSCQMTPRPISEAGEEGDDYGKEGGVDDKNCLYWLAIAQLKYCFAEDVRGLIKGYCLTLIPVAGPDFVAAFRRFEPVALFILMYFGVLFDRYGQEPMMWWIASTGRDLVKETSEVLLQSPIAQIDDGREGIAWTRRQVGLPPFDFGRDDCVDPNLLVL